MIFVISAPSGAGKTTIIKELFRNIPDLRFSVSATTRKKRPDEQEGEDYYFITREEFNEMIDKGEFIEWEEVHGNLYGTLKKKIEPFVSGNEKLVLDVDVKGALSIKKVFPDAVMIFIKVPDEELISRLRDRNTESEAELSKRIMRIKEEQKLSSEFDFVIENRNSSAGPEEAVKKIKEIIQNYNKGGNNANSST
ncbi:MAG: guanylate kinase [Ignavibacteria bacterium]|nr:guanylate kinase [Ignavibacteria bacterium]